MDVKKATEILTEEGYFDEDGELVSTNNKGDYSSWAKGTDTIILDGEFATSELEALAVYINHRNNL